MIDYHFKVNRITNVDSNSKKIADIEIDEQQINEIKEGLDIVINKESAIIESTETSTDEKDENQLQRYKICQDKLKAGLNQLNYNDLADISLAINEKIRQVEREQGNRADELIAKLKELRKIKEELRT